MRSVALRALALLLIVASGCAKNGKLPYDEVVRVPVPEQDSAQTVEVPGDVLVISDAPALPLDAAIETGSLEGTTHYHHIREETWRRRPWRWKATPGAHLQVAGYMALGGAVLLAAGLVGEGDSDAKGTALGLGAGLLVASPVPLFVLGVRKLETRDSLKGVSEKDEPFRTDYHFTRLGLFSGALPARATGADGNTIDASLIVDGGAFAPERATLRYVDSVDLVHVRAGSGIEIRWDLSDLSPVDVFARHQDYLLGKPGVNKLFDASFREWEAARQTKARQERDRRLAGAVTKCGVALVASEGCNSLFSSDDDSWIRKLIVANGCEWAAAKLTGSRFGASDALQTSVASLVEQRYPQYANLLKGGLLAGCVASELR